MKLTVIFFLTLISTSSFARNICDLDVSKKFGVVVVEFKEKNKTISKMAFKDSTPGALIEEMYNLQDMNLCSHKIVQAKCGLKVNPNNGLVTFVRGNKDWVSWSKSSISYAQNYLQEMKRVGFCS
ncbi:MAG TPA: hypothetical protein VKZ84_00750 [Bacteriovoracaceae bacterium]|nr:hypothetical protein [Bacteriovoracaceae bacterium]